MPDGIQSRPPERPLVPGADVRHTGDFQRSPKKSAVLLCMLIGVPVAMVVLCGGILTIGALGLLLYDQAPAPVNRGPVLIPAVPGMRDRNLEWNEIGLDPDLPTNFDVDRIEEVTVPGPPPKPKAP
jgi:hypothetical protein